MATLIKDRNQIILSDNEATAVHAVAREEPETLAWVHADGSTTDLHPEVAALVRQALEVIATAGSVSISVLPQELTSNVAAELLGISRPTLLKLAREGKIDSFSTGSHTRFSQEAILKFKDAREKQKKQLLGEIQELGNLLDG